MKATVGAGSRALVMAGARSFGPKITGNSRSPHDFFHSRGEVRRCSNAVHEAASQVAMWWGWTPPDPGFRMAIEVGGGDAGDVGDVVVVGQRLTGEGLAAEEAPASSPAFHQVEPGSPDGNEGVVDAWMRGCVASHTRMGPLLWLARLSATRWRSPCG